MTTVLNPVSTQEKISRKLSALSNSTLKRNFQRKINRFNSVNVSWQEKMSLSTLIKLMKRELVSRSIEPTDIA